MSLLSQTPVGREQHVVNSFKALRMLLAGLHAPVHSSSQFLRGHPATSCAYSLQPPRAHRPQQSLTPLSIVAVSCLYGERISKTKPLTMHPTKPSAPCSAVKDHCFAQIRIACKPWPPVLRSISVVTVSVRRPSAGHHASSSLSSVSFGCFPPAYTTRHASHALLEGAAICPVLCLWGYN